MLVSAVCARSSLAQVQGSVLPKIEIQQQQLQLRQQQLNSDVSAVPYMLIEDEVHGVIELPIHIQEIVNHAQFQRLKKIKQLGLLSLSSQSQGTHTRYDHCIGTYKSAQDLLNALRRNSNYEPELPLWCRQAVEIAALLHDIGHGPFSHYWEQVCNGTFDHETNAMSCVDQIFADAQCSELRSLRDDSNGRGVQLIKALILGKPELLTYPMMGHGYIFDIVHNSRCGLDVDKWDYLRRDNKRMNILSEDDMKFDDLFLKARISPDGRRIEYRYEDYHLIYKLYVARWRLHIDAYQLPKSLAYDIILARIVQRQQPHLMNIRSENKEWLDLIDDNVLQLIENDPQSMYLTSPERWFETTVCDEQNEDCVCVRREKRGPGLDMQPDECYALYGDKSKKRNIDRNITPTPINACFKLV